MNTLRERTLKIKIKSLAEEAKIIRKEERKVLGWGRALSEPDKDGYPRGFNKSHREGEEKPAPKKSLVRPNNWEEEKQIAYEQYWNLHHHRTLKLRRMARTSNLAYGFLRGLPYSQIESSGAREGFDAEEVKKIALKGQSEEASLELSERYDQWLDDAKAYIMKLRDEALDQILEAEIENTLRQTAAV